MLNPWHRTLYAVIDTETTDLNPGWARPCAIGGVTIQNGTLNSPELYETLINPEKTISKAAIGIHGITRAAVKEKSTFNEQRRKFYDFLGNKVIVVHTDYDIRVLRRRMQDYRFPLILDTCKLARKVNPELSNHKLENLIQHYGLEPRIQKRLGERCFQPHDAFCDAVATGYLFLALVRRNFPNKTPLEVLARKCALKEK